MFNWVSAQIQAIRLGVAEDIRGLFDWVSYQINNLGSFNFDWINDYINEVYSFIISVPDQIRDFVYNVAGEFTNYLFNAFEWINGIKERIIQLINIFTNGFINNLLDLVNKWYPLFVSFFDDPVKFLYDLFWPSFLIFLNYIIAYALGTVKYDLPAKPDFRKNSLPK